MSTITADDIDTPVAAHEHLMPSKHRFVRERGVKIFVEIDHHLRDAAFSGRQRTAVLAQTELPLQGMRVLPHCLPWVVDLIGSANAGLCPSLPAHVRSNTAEAQEI
jgi:hypothetical protein